MILRIALSTMLAAARFLELALFLLFNDEAGQSNYDDDKKFAVKLWSLRVIILKGSAPYVQCRTCSPGRLGTRD